MNIYLKELRAHRRSLLVWSGIIILFTVTAYSKFSAFYNTPEVLALLDAMPGVVSALSLDAFNLTTVTGFFGMAASYMSLLLAVAAAMWGSDIIAKEERDRTVEFALTLPVTRRRLLSAKAAATVTLCVLLLLVTWGVTLAGAQSYGPDGQFYRFVSLTMLGFFLLQLLFAALGFLLGCALRSHKRASAAAMALLLVAYFAALLPNLSVQLDWLRYITPFSYFDAARILRDARLEPLSVTLALLLAVACMLCAYVTYQRKDIYT